MLSYLCKCFCKRDRQIPAEPCLSVRVWLKPKAWGAFFFFFLSKHLCARFIFPTQNTVEGVRTEKCLFKSCSFCKQNHKYSQKKEKIWSELVSDFSILQLMEMSQTGFVESYKIFKLWRSLSTNLRQNTSAKDHAFSLAIMPGFTLQYEITEDPKCNFGMNSL